MVSSPGKGVGQEASLPEEIAALMSIHRIPGHSWFIPVVLATLSF